MMAASYPAITKTIGGCIIHTRSHMFPHTSENCSGSGVELDNWTEVEFQEDTPLQAQLQVSGS